MRLGLNDSISGNCNIFASNAIAYAGRQRSCLCCYFFFSLLILSTFRQAIQVFPLSWVFCASMSEPSCFLRG